MHGAAWGGDGLCVVVLNTEATGPGFLVGPRQVLTMIKCDTRNYDRGRRGQATNIGGGGRRAILRHAAEAELHAHAFRTW